MTELEATVEARQLVWQNRHDLENLGPDCRFVPLPDELPLAPPGSILGPRRLDERLTGLLEGEIEKSGSVYHRAFQSMASTTRQHVLLTGSWDHEVIPFDDHRPPLTVSKRAADLGIDIGDAFQSLTNFGN